jgi:hypothetical protein
LAAAGDMAPDFAGQTWFLSKGGQVQTYRTEESTTRGGPSTLMFRDDGTFEATGPGRADRSGVLTGRWHSDAGDPTRVTVEVEGQRIEYRVVKVGEDELQLEELVRSPGPSSPP